ncbi:MAG: LemA protein [Verrucomicrobiota bacterium]|jgi:LemA protein|nr:LemA protein [Verrucomicrobiota bacterium]
MQWINFRKMEDAMKKIWIVLGIIALVIVLVIGSLVGSRNRFVALEEGVDAQWANVETVLQRRFDLIPNLVNTVKGYAAHEEGLLTRVTELRSQWAAAKTTDQKIGIANELQGTLGRLMLVAENYPDLKANQNFLALQDELAGTENRIAVERRRYNESVQAYNTAIRKFPGVLWAGIFGFERRTPFESAPEASAVPNVNF